MKYILSFFLFGFSLCASAQDLLQMQDGKVYPVKILDFADGHFLFQSLADSSTKQKKVLYGFISKYHTTNRPLINKVEAYDRNAYEKLMSSGEASDHWFKIDKTVLRPSTLTPTESPKTVTPSQLTSGYHLERAGTNLIGASVFVGVAIVVPQLILTSVKTDATTTQDLKKVENQRRAAYWIGAISGTIGLACFTAGGIHLRKSGKRLQANKELSIRMGLTGGSLAFRF